MSTPSPAFSPAAGRNRQPILEVLQQVLPAQGHALEIASGTGQHVTWFARHLPRWTWQPTDTYDDALQSIAAYVALSQLDNVLPARLLDVLNQPWLEDAETTSQFDAIYCANMLHISPWATCAALMQGSALHLAPGGLLITYGPYLEDDVPTSQGNRDFDLSLRAQNPAWGIRRREDVESQAARAGLHLLQRFAMPANNLLLVWGRRT
jgi:hypothetical protein